MTSTTDQVRQQLEAGLAALVKDRPQKIKAIDDEITSVRAATKALGPAEFAKASHRSSPRAMAKLADTPVVASAGKLLTILKGTEGMTTRQLAKETGGDPAALLELLKGLEADGKVSRTGEKAATRWHLVTDDERVSARVAEMEQQGEKVTADQALTSAERQQRTGSRARARKKRRCPNPRT